MNRGEVKTRASAGPVEIAPLLNRMLAKNMMSSVTIGAVNAVVAALLLTGSIDWRILAGWVFVVSALSLGRGLYCQRLLKQDAPASPVQLRWLAAATLLAGISWGALPFLLNEDAPAMGLHIIIFMVAGMTAAASLSYASRIWITRTFNAPCVGLVAAYYVLSGGIAHLAMAGVLMIYFLSTDQFARRANRNLVSVIENKTRAESQHHKIENQKTALEALTQNYRLTTEKADKAESNLIRTSAELALIFDNVPVRIWCKDDKNIILRLNQAAADSMGVPLEEALGADTYDLFPEMAKKYHDDDLSVIQSGKAKLGIVEEYTPADGTKGWVRTDKVPYTDVETGRKLVFVAAVDITDLYRAREELTQANEELAEFARVVSHDLQEPLKEMSAHGARLKELGKETLSVAAQEEIDRILEASERLRGLVNSVLNLARMPYSQLSLQNVNPEECIDAARHAMGFDGETPNLKFLSEPLPEVLAEPALLTRIYQNLISNAVKFSAGRTPIQVDFTSEIEGEDVILGVRDNGVGMDPANAERVFEPLVRAHDRERFHGTGIGLAICKRGVERMGGKIWVETAPDAGAHFKFRLKAAAKTERSASQNQRETCYGAA